MGVDLARRRPVLPAPTDSVLTSADDTGLNTDVATDLSIKTNATSQTIPADGTPITIKTGQKPSAMTKLLKTGSQSQTSLLIEYFEGSGAHDPSERRPSVRVKVTPSKSSKHRVRSEGQVVVTETRGTRRPSVSRRIAVGTDSNSRVEDLGSISSLEEAREAERLGAPIEIEVRPDGSEVSALSESPDARYIVPGSDISSMPPDSMLGVQRPGAMTSTSRSESISQHNGLAGTAALGGAAAAAAIAADKNAQNDRFPRKVIEKLSNRPRNTGGNRAVFAEQTRSESSVGRDAEVLATRDRRRRAGKLPEEGSMTSGTVSSMVSSMPAGERASVDQRSTVSGNSNISVNNPKLLQAVEDAIKRLLPELQELRKDQRTTSRQVRNEKDLTPSDISGSSFSREEEIIRHDSGGKARRRSSRGTDQVVTSGSRRRERQRRLNESPSERGSRHSESIESMSVEEGAAPKSRRTRDLAAGALGGAALTAAALRSHESISSAENRERRRVGSRSRSSRSASFVESEEIFHKHAVPPMPLRSEVDSELTRSSLLSSHTTGTATPTHREVREVVRGSPRAMSSATSPTPTDYRPPMDIKKGLGTYHGNFSEHDLPVRREQLDESEEEEEEYDDFDDSQLAGQPFETTRHHDEDLFSESERMKRYERNLHQQHPIRRGLSPIQSVASYTTTDPNRNSMHQPRSVDSLASLKKRQDLKEQVSMSSLSSAPSTDLARSHRPKGINLETRSQILGQHQADGTNHARDVEGEEFFEEQHNQNQQYREPYSSPGPRIGLQGLSDHPNRGSDEFRHAKVTAGQQVEQNAVSNPEYVHIPTGVESAVASLCEPSVVDERSVVDETSTREIPFAHSGQHAAHYGYQDSPRAQFSHSPHHSYHSQQSFDEVYHDSPHLPAPRSPHGSQHSLRSFEQNQFESSRAPVSQSPHYSRHSQQSIDQDYHDSSRAPLNRSPLNRSPHFAEHSRHSLDQSSRTSPRLPQHEDEVIVTKTGSPLKQQLSMHSHEDVVHTGISEGEPLSQNHQYSVHSQERIHTAGTGDVISPSLDREQYIHSREDVIDKGDRGIPLPVMGQQQHPRSQENITNADPREMISPIYAQQRSLNSQQNVLHGGHHGIASPPQSVSSRSVSDLGEHNATYLQPEINTDVPVAKHENISPESEITTNPSVIHGPIGALHQSNRDSWTFDQTPSRAKAGLPYAGGAVAGGLAGADLIPEPLSMNRDPGYDPGRDLYTSKQVMSTPPVAKDEGYVSGANPRSPNSYPRERKIPTTDINNQETVTDAMDIDDPFVTKKRDQYASGLSDGMFGLYDNATGKAIDRIHSKDIVALMDHLTVRDAQRNARDTEILVTLVRTAAEMRNSFEDMKKFIAEQDDLIMDTADIQHEKTQKVVVDNKGQVSSSARGARGIISPDDDTPAKRKSAFKRMLNGLGTKNSKELQNIEAMLMQLLDEVETLRDLQTGVIQPHELLNAGQNSTDDARMATDGGYEPEGRAGMTSMAMQSNDPSRQVDQRDLNPQLSRNRMSTVQEHDGEYGRNGPHQGSTPLGPIQDGAAYAREVSEHYYTPEGNMMNQGVQSNDYAQHLPQGETSGKKKSFIPSFSKMVSRWSKTTASSGGDQYRSSAGVRFRPTSQSSQSDSEVGEYPYEPQGGDRLRSNTSLQDEHYRNQENRPPSPLVPSAVSDNPKYQAHRDSFNLVHPQPRQGPTGRYQSHLESEAQNYPQTYQPATDRQLNDRQKSDQGQYSDQNYPHGRLLSPISDDGYSDRQSNRSVSTMSDGSVHRSSRLPAGSEPLVPSRVGKVMSPPGNRQATYLDHVAAARAGSPAFDKSPVNALRSSPGQARKPSGPRPITHSSPQGKNPAAEYGGPKKTRFRNSPNQIDSDEEMGRN